MLNDLIGNVEQYIHSSPWLAVVAVFLGGLMTAANPCCLAMIPLIMSFVAGRKEDRIGAFRALGYSLALVLGLSITFIVLGVAAALAGTLYGDVSGLWKWVVGAICLLMGLHLLGLLNIPIPSPVRSQPKIRGMLGALVMGLLFGFVSAPCAAPILIVLLVSLASSGTSVPYGAFLLLIYSLGHSVLILVAGTSMGAARRLIESKNLIRATAVMQRAAGGLIILVGIYFVWSGQ